MLNGKKAQYHPVYHPVSLNEEEMQRGGERREEVSKAGSYVHLANMPMIESLRSQCG